MCLTSLYMLIHYGKQSFQRVAVDAAVASCTLAAVRPRFKIRSGAHVIAWLYIELDGGKRSEKHLEVFVISCTVLGLPSVCVGV